MRGQCQCAGVRDAREITVLTCHSDWHVLFAGPMSVRGRPRRAGNHNTHMSLRLACFIRRASVSTQASETRGNSQFSLRLAHVIGRANVSARASETRGNSQFSLRLTHVIGRANVSARASETRGNSQFSLRLACVISRASVSARASGTRENSYLCSHMTLALQAQVCAHKRCKSTISA